MRLAGDMRTGIRVGVDVGSVRVGVSASDATGTLASPVSVLRRDVRADRDLDELAALVAEREAVEVVVGLPLHLRGAEGVAAAGARRYAAALAALVAPVPVRLVDERLTTTEAARALRASGRTARTSRDVIDAAAAVVLLQSALDSERNTGMPAGELLEVDT
jgi:putative holliday junction resolvase